MIARYLLEYPYEILRSKRDFTTLFILIQIIDRAGLLFTALSQPLSTRKDFQNSQPPAFVPATCMFKLPVGSHKMVTVSNVVT